MVYDDHGGYGHPDHVQVHRVGVRAAELAGTPVVYEATFDRDRMVAQLRAARETVSTACPTNHRDESLGVSSELITTRIDVSAQADVKRRAMGCHRSQIGDTSFFLALARRAVRRRVRDRGVHPPGSPSGYGRGGLGSFVDHWPARLSMRP